ncbi:MAG: Wzy polymerase domain-containing protein [Pseudomonadota bacterium]
MVIAPFVSWQNWAGNGLELPFNISVWMAASLTIFFSLLLALQKTTFTLPRPAWPFILAPLILFIATFLTGHSQSSTLFFRELYVLGGIAFFFALFQHKMGRGTVDQLLLWCAILMTLHALVGVLQIYLPSSLAGLYGTLDDRMPRGAFQQINIHASYLATGLLVLFYCLSRPVTRNASRLVRVLIVLYAFTGTLVVLQSGSRVALLSLVVGLVFLALRHRYFAANKKLVGIVLLATLVGGALGAEGLARSAHKMQTESEGIDSSIRLSMYSVVLELIAQKPILGHGFGEFRQAWNTQVSDFLHRNPQAQLPAKIVHPHNELMYLMIEGGLLTISGLLLAAFFVLRQLTKLGLRQAGGYTALLVPVVLHTQVELPLYQSAAHWMWLCLFVYVIMRHSSRVVLLAPSQASLIVSHVGATLLFLGAVYFLVHSAISQRAVMAFARTTDASLLQPALSNHYFSEIAVTSAMRVKLHKGIATNDHNAVAQFLEWVPAQIESTRDLRLYEDKIAAYSFLKDKDGICGVVAEGLKQYPQYDKFQFAAKQCP